MILRSVKGNLYIPLQELPDFPLALTCAILYPSNRGRDESVSLLFLPHNKFRLATGTQTPRESRGAQKPRLSKFLRAHCAEDYINALPNTPLPC